MSDDPAAGDNAPAGLDFRTHPDAYRHWRLEFEGPVAWLTMDVDEQAPAFEGYELKLNSYDISVDIELYDAMQRLRLEHPAVRTVVLRSAKSGMFCAGANIRMLGSASHSHKVNFCKFTNETRNAMEDASQCSKQRYLSALNGTAAGGGYELALATDYIMLVDDGNAAVSLPEIPLLAVLPGTGGLTRLVDKRKVRRDLADVFCTVEEGVKGKRAAAWRLVDEVVPSSRFEERVRAQAQAMADTSDRPRQESGIPLAALERHSRTDAMEYPHLALHIDRGQRNATLTIHAPASAVADDVAAAKAEGSTFWPLAVVRALDDALLHLRFNEPEIGTLIVKTVGDAAAVQAVDALLQTHQDDWWIREILLYWKRTLKRFDLTSRTAFALVEPGSCFTGLLAELLFAVDRSYMLDGQFEDDPRPPATIQLSALNFGAFPMSNGLSRLATRFLGEPEQVDLLRRSAGESLEAADAYQAGLVTFIPDDIDWEDEIRLLLEERASFSPDALTAMEANLRFAGPETMETKIFGRLSAWQNWIFQRPNAVSDTGALRRYGTGERAQYDRKRV